MSFDSTFDYSGALTFIDDRIENTINVEIGIIETNLTDLGGIPASLNYLTAPKIASQTHTKGVYETMRTNLQTLKSEIQVVTGLSSGDKTTLYTFYNDAINEPVPQWMGRMLFNTTSLLAEAGNINGETLSETEKDLLGEIICENNPIQNSVHQIIRHFPSA